MMRMFVLALGLTGGWKVATSSFTVSPQTETVSSTYDAMGRIATRTWSGGKV